MIFPLLAGASCDRKDQRATEGNSAVAQPSVKPPAAVPLPAPLAKLDREQLILAAVRSLSASALGTNDAEAQSELKGREFELRLRFGCPGVADSSRSWSYDEKTGVLRARFVADLQPENVPESQLVLSGHEGIVGFPIEQPLLLSAGCPAPQFATAFRSGPVIAVSQLLTSDDSRVQRPQKTYEITKTVDPAAKPTEGLDLVISGRLAELADRRVIHCGPTDGAAACIIAAKFDRVAIENPVDRVVLGQWSQW
jgi:hypothetical protein